MEAMQELVQLQEEKKQLEEKVVNCLRFLITPLCVFLQRTNQIAEALSFARDRYGGGGRCLPDLKTTPRNKIFPTVERGCIEVPVRDSNIISVAFTPRIFPTPERESMKHDEETVSFSVKSVLCPDQQTCV